MRNRVQCELPNWHSKKKRKSNKEEQWGRLKDLLTIFYSRGLEGRHTVWRGRRGDKNEREVSNRASQILHIPKFWSEIYVPVLIFRRDKMEESYL